MPHFRQAFSGQLVNKLDRWLFYSGLSRWRLVGVCLNTWAFFTHGTAIKLLMSTITIGPVSCMFALAQVGIARFFGGKGFRFKFSTYVRAITKGLGLRQATHANVLFLAFFYVNLARSVIGNKRVHSLARRLTKLLIFIV